MDEKLDEVSRRKVFATALLTDDFEPGSALVRADIGAYSDRGRILRDNDDHYLVVRLGRSEETIQTSLTAETCPTASTNMHRPPSWQTASRRTPREQCDLVGAALANGGTDNVTVVLANDHIPSPLEDSQ
jgi:hypothetical protein